MALKSKEDVTLSVQRRWLLLFTLCVPLLGALCSFGVKQFGIPNWPGRVIEAAQRGAIYSSDGTVLAEGTAEHRRYPQGDLAAHIIGFSGAQQPDGRYGLEGIEYTLDADLQAGEPIMLTLNAKLQAITQAQLRDTVETFEADNGTAVILEAKTGRILAAASYPDYNPNLRNLSEKALMNRAFLQQYEPGSVMKPFVVASLLDSGRLQPNEKIPAEMHFRVGDKTFRDVVTHDPVLPVWDILRFSSNTGMIHLSERLSSGELFGWLQEFGFGQDLVLGSSYTQSGNLPPWYQWVPQDHASITIGQGVSTTALQLAAAYSIFANDGYYIPPKLLEHATTAEPHQVIAPEVAMTIRRMLQYTVEQGSGLRTAKLPGVPTAGKTGTADFYDVETGRYLEDAYTVSFAGIFPADEPEFTVVVSVQRPTLSSSSTYVAAPLFHKIGMEILALQGEATPAPAFANSF